MMAAEEDNADAQEVLDDLLLIIRGMSCALGQIDDERQPIEVPDDLWENLNVQDSERHTG